MDKLKLWIEEQYEALKNEAAEVEIAQYKREGMLIATETIYQKYLELTNEDSKPGGGKEEGAEEVTN